MRPGDEPFLVLGSNVHDWGGMAKNGHFSWNFDLFSTFLMDCGHIYVPNGMNWFFLRLGPLFMTGDGPKMVHFGPKMTKHGKFVDVQKWFERVLKGPKWST